MMKTHSQLTVTLLSSVAVYRVSDATARVLDANACVSTASTDGIRKVRKCKSGRRVKAHRLYLSSSPLT